MPSLGAGGRSVANARGSGGSRLATPARQPVGGQRTPLCLTPVRLPRGGAAGIAALRSRRPCSSTPSRQQRQLVAQPRAAADAAAGEGGGAPQQQPALQAKRPQREMSMQQRWRAFKFAVQEALQRLSETPPALAVLAALAAVNARLQPLYDAAAWLSHRWQALVETYQEFCVEETKRQWRWSKVNAREMRAWAQVPAFVAYLLLTLLYEAFMPVAFLPAVVLPLYYAWLGWDDWWRSPVFLGLLLTAPMKWLPWAEMSLVWPGVI